MVSIFDRYLDVQDELTNWLDYGARLLFLVNPQRRTVDVHHPNQPIRTFTEDDVLDGEKVVSGWSRPVSELFDEP